MPEQTNNPLYFYKFCIDSGMKNSNKWYSIAILLNRNDNNI